MLKQIMQDRRNLKTVFIVSCLCLLLLLSLTTIHIVNGESEAAAKISEAKNALNSAYEAVSQAAKAGANVTSLLNTLNEAGDLLSKAELAISTNESAAISFALESEAKLNGVLADADVLKAAASQQGFWDFMINVVGSIAGAVAVICGGFVVWTVLKRKYEKTGSGV